MRKCNQCNEVKALNEFGSNRTQPQGKSYMCKKCRRMYDKQRYKSNPEDAKKRFNKHRAKKRAINEIIIWEAVQAPCADCGLIDPIAMEFDHRPEEEKLYNIGSMVGNTYSYETLIAEISKCDIVCAVCHRYRTNKRGEWWRYGLTNEMT